MKFLLIAAFFFMSAPAFATLPCVIPPKQKKSTPIPLCFAKERIRAILTEYSQDPSTAANGLPPLRKAEISFKTVRTKKAGLAVSVFVFNFANTVQTDQTKEVVDSWDVPQAPPNKGFTSTATYVSWLAERKKKRRKKAGADFPVELRQFIKEIAEQEKAAPSEEGNGQHTVTIAESFGVQWNIKAGATIPVQLVTVGPSVEHNRADTQSVKLTFSKKETKDNP